MKHLEYSTHSGGWIRLATRMLSLLLFTSLSIAGTAKGEAPTYLEMIGERPELNDEPTSVSIGLFIFDVDEIDDVKQRFSVDMFISVRWHDHRVEGNNT